MKEQMRAEFEAWAESRCYYLDRDAEDKYIKCTTALAWEIWKAAQPKVNRHKDKLDNQLADEAIRLLQAAGYETLGCAIADEIFALKDRITALSAVPAQEPVEQESWLPIETAPKDFLTVFDGWNGERVADVFWGHPEYAEKGVYDWVTSEYVQGFGHEHVRVANLTHWMPLPLPPVEANHD
jgi:hypothetical protein